MSNPILRRYPVGAVVQRRDGKVYVKTKENGLVAKSRMIAAVNSKVINGGEELQPGWRVVHLNMATFGTDDHDKPENLAVIKCGAYKWEFLKRSRVLFLPKNKLAGAKAKELVLT